MSRDNEKKFITSPADVEMHRKVHLQDAEVTDEFRERSKQLCENIQTYFHRTPLIWEDSSSLEWNRYR